jgi:hypothetical protein
MWDEMVTVIVIEKDNKMVTTFEVAQTNVEGSLVIKVPKHSDDILGARMLWKPKEARILKNFIDQPM